MIPMAESISTAGFVNDLKALHEKVSLLIASPSLSPMTTGISAMGRIASM